MSDSVKESASSSGIAAKKEEEVKIVEIVRRKTIEESEVIKVRVCTRKPEEDIHGRKRENQEEVQKAAEEVIKPAKIHSYLERRRSVEAGHSIDPDPKIPLKDLKVVSKK